MYLQAAVHNGSGYIDQGLAHGAFVGAAGSPGPAGGWGWGWDCAHGALVGPIGPGGILDVSGSRVGFAGGVVPCPLAAAQGAAVPPGGRPGWEVDVAHGALVPISGGCLGVVDGACPVGRA